MHDITTLGALKETVSLVLSHAVPNLAGATILALHGDLGAGKTTFVQTLARELGVTATVTSPTFVVMKQYELEEKSWQQLVHIDTYRFEDISEAGPLRFTELFQDPANIVCIEWAERIAELLPPTTTHLHFSITGEQRTLTIS